MLSLKDCRAVIRKNEFSHEDVPYEDFGKSLAAQDLFATELIVGGHSAADDVAQKHAMLLARPSAFLEKSNARCLLLLEDYNRLQQFERAFDETKGNFFEFS